METKRTRGNAKGVVTRKIKEITDLMTDESNVDQVIEKTKELEEALKKFQVAHGTYHSQLTEREEIEESSHYYNLVIDQVEGLQENVDFWLTGIETTRLMTSFQIRPEDSVSNIDAPSQCLEFRHATHAGRKAHATRANRKLHARRSRHAPHLLALEQMPLLKGPF